MALTDVAGPIDVRLRVSMQASLFDLGRLACRPLSRPPAALDGRSSVYHEPGWLEGSDAVFEQLREELPWRSVKRPMYDRIVDVPRLICTIEPSELATEHPLVMITYELERVLGAGFSSIGANYYRDGHDSVAWHRDRIGNSGRPSTVALLSLGSPRTFAMRPHRAHPSCASKTAETTAVTRATRHQWRLGHGDLLVMRGACQREWEHCVSKERGAGARISLAFRCRHAAEGPRLTDAGVPPLWASHNLQ